MEMTLINLAWKLRSKYSDLNCDLRFSKNKRREDGMDANKAMQFQKLTNDQLAFRSWKRSKPPSCFTKDVLTRLCQKSVTLLRGF